MEISEVTSSFGMGGDNFRVTDKGLVKIYSLALPFIARLWGVAAKATDMTRYRKLVEDGDDDKLYYSFENSYKTIEIIEVWYL
jgi:hypothetical protein